MKNFLKIFISIFLASGCGLLVPSQASAFEGCPNAWVTSQDTNWLNRANRNFLAMRFDNPKDLDSAISQSNGSIVLTDKNEEVQLNDGTWVAVNALATYAWRPFRAYSHILSGANARVTYTVEKQGCPTPGKLIYSYQVPVFPEISEVDPSTWFNDPANRRSVADDASSPLKNDPTAFNGWNFKDTEKLVSDINLCAGEMQKAANTRDIGLSSDQNASLSFFSPATTPSCNAIVYNLIGFTYADTGCLHLNMSAPVLKVGESCDIWIGGTSFHFKKVKLTGPKPATKIDVYSTPTSNDKISVQQPQTNPTSPKLVTIQCIKNKILKKIKGIKPICPSGWKNKK